MSSKTAALLLLTVLTAVCYAEDARPGSPPATVGWRVVGVVALSEGAAMLAMGSSMAAGYRRLDEETDQLLFLPLDDIGSGLVVASAALIVTSLGCFVRAERVRRGAALRLDFSPHRGARIALYLPLSRRESGAGRRTD